jgi:hypothetical protein
VFYRSSPKTVQEVSVKLVLRSKALKVHADASRTGLSHALPRRTPCYCSPDKLELLLKFRKRQEMNAKAVGRKLPQALPLQL